MTITYQIMNNLNLKQEIDCRTKIFAETLCQNHFLYLKFKE